MKPRGTCLAPGIEYCEACEGKPNVLPSAEMPRSLERFLEEDDGTDYVEVDLDTGKVIEGTVVEAPAPEMFPSQIGVFCDRCRVVFTGDFMVSEDDDQKTRFGYARTHLNDLGWRCDETGDFCPTCKSKVEG